MSAWCTNQLALKLHLEDISTLHTTRSVFDSMFMLLLSAQDR